MRLELIEKILEDFQDTTDVFKRNAVKEYLQILALSFIYSARPYQDLVFYGGSCLKHCFDLPRLSEDLDFVDLKKDVNLDKLAEDLKKFFKKELSIDITAKIQKFRIYLKFPVLRELRLTGAAESDFLILKIEVFNEFDFCGDYRVEMMPVFKFGNSLLVKTFDLPTLMATKIRAILFRRWEKIDKSGKILARAKGRDYFDLMWYFEKGIAPNLKCIYGNEAMSDELKRDLLRAVKSIDKRSVSFDLEGLIKDRVFLNNLSGNIKDILIRNIENKL